VKGDALVLLNSSSSDDEAAGDSNKSLGPVALSVCNFP